MKKSAADRILMFLKMRGEATSLLISEELSITKEGARKHLLNLAQEGLIRPDVKSEGVGRPSTYYILTEKGLAQFPDTHADVTVQLLKSVKNLLGENALELLISDREKNTHDRYEKALSKTRNLEQRLEVLAQARSKEGYMAEWKKEGNEYFLIENHCPICAAATECQGFCRAELSNFQSLIGKEYTVERVDHIISGGQRCVYKIS
ncbi:metalloregulator ArsR/SmtB family transcription factor [Chryseobacterium arthrosphaerae]|uniref:Metalloregulator ArsR/SmtB family transcription factor n=1 Tax=Chryseobacterium arthrosphaerae TaxID=651561 RepID=A0A1B8ZPC9_9FLAO|nr:metalloregulator ArsR/SmtB family transcription factor [Chryseobacterium arthrosphaerae]OCA73445.1 transcriptional regulator [Chryseobacterium arthrosphaerae]QUY57030.1 transcriptional regulator [Chryseobacterium arthrosphaerae]UEQ76902.1 transcriptional regulator [Chryseobacterium arthrosphaerae]